MAASSCARKTNLLRPRNGDAGPVAVAYVMKICPVCAMRRIFRVITWGDGTRTWRDRKGHAWQSGMFTTPATLDGKGRIDLGPREPHAD